LASASFCLLAPLALFLPWAVVPDHLGIATAGWPFFREWLTKHPTLGPINAEVGIGIACIVLSSLLPFAFALYSALSRSPKRIVVALFVVAELLAIVPLVVRLDYAMWICALLPSSGGEFFGHPSRIDCGGAVLRGLAAVNLLTLSALSLRRSTG
jgi:hypothetical protein